MAELKERIKKVNSESAKELEKVKNQFDDFDKQVKDLTHDRLNAAPKEETEPQTKLSSKEIEKSKDVYLKPHRTLTSKEKFNEKFREDWNFLKEYVNFIAENKELIGENIDLWTKPFPGIPAEEWIVPTNKPVWGPRYLAEQIKRKSYHRLTMQEQQLSNMGEIGGMGQMYGKLVVDTTVQRLDANPVTKNKSVFMGKNF